MTIDLSRIVELCGNATPGPYIIQGFGCQGPHRFIRIASGNCDDAKPGDIHGICKVAKHNAENNAHYLSTLDPETILALCKAVTAAVEFYKEGQRVWNPSLEALRTYLAPFTPSRGAM